MNYRIILSNSFLKEAKRLAKKYRSFKEDLEILQNELQQNPYSGIDLGNGLRKVRMAIKSKGRGKSHGARVITYLLLVSEEESEINLLTIYDKAERENISRNEIEAIMGIELWIKVQSSGFKKSRALLPGRECVVLKKDRGLCECKDSTFLMHNS